MGANRPPSEGVEYRLGSSIIKTAAPKKKWSHWVVGHTTVKAENSQPSLNEAGVVDLEISSKA
jgi:hypothetical protein